MKVIQVKKQHLKRILALIIFSCFVLSFYLHTNSDQKLKSAKHHSKKHKNESVKKAKYHKDGSEDATEQPKLDHKARLSKIVNSIPFEEVKLDSNPIETAVDNPIEVVGEARIGQNEESYEEYVENVNEGDLEESEEDAEEVHHYPDDEADGDADALEILNSLPHVVSDLALSANVDTGIVKLTLDDILPSDVEGYPRLVDGLGNYENRPEMPELGEGDHSGPGEGGKTPVELNDEEQEQVRSQLSLWGFNMVASNKVSLDRIPADLRMDECKHWEYPEKLPSVSVILVFHNEGFTTLMRTVHSVINLSPPELLYEVVMVDDGSTRDYIAHGAIGEYIKRFNGIVKLYHNNKREGLIRARTIGAKHAQASVLVYLDAHCEVENNWLPPLISPIAQDYKACTVPMVDSIDGNTYVFEPQQGGDENNLARGAWDWNFDWKRIPLNAREKARRKTVSEPYRSPAMAGGLFAISAKWFKELGYYDDKLEIWGGENFEISYKLWQCGGQLLFVPCSRVGHIYRMQGWGGNGTPDELKGKNFIAVNYNRVIETWWDSYKTYYYERRPENKNVSPGDLTEVRAIREKLQCKSFEWYMKEIAYDIPKYWPLRQPTMIATGQLKNLGTGKCAQAKSGMANGDVITTTECSSKDIFTLSWHEDIGPGDGTKTPNHCWDTEMDTNGVKSLCYWECHKQHGNQLYKYLPKTKQIYNPGHHMCVTAKESDNFVYFARCDPDDTKQQWDWDLVNEEPLQRANNNPEGPGDDPAELDYVQ